MTARANLLTVLFCLTLSVLPVAAEGIDGNVVYRPVPGTVEMVPTTVVLKPEIPDTKQRKLKFKEKHPRIYVVYRKSRTVAIALGPVVGLAANVANIVTPILLR